MVKRIAPVGVVSFVLLSACGAVCQNVAQSLPDAPSVQATDQKQNFKVFIEEARSFLKIGAAGDRVSMARQGEFAASNHAASSRKESNAIFGKYQHPPLLNRQPGDQSLTSGNLMGRAICAASGILVTRDDSGKIRLNTSYVLRTLTSVAADTASRPYWRRSFGDPFSDGDRTGTGAATHTWLRSALVVSEFAVALVLLNASGAFLRSFQKMHAVDPGFRPDHVLVAAFQLPVKQYSTRASSDAFDRDIVERLSSKPGIVAVGITWYLPELGGGRSAYTIENEPVDRWKLKFAGFAITYGDYFRAIGIPLIEGRYFTPDDRSDTPLVMIVNQSMARHAWPGQSPLGKRMLAGNPKKDLPWAIVVGVVADTKLNAPDEPSIEQWYAPMQQPATLYGTEPSRNLGGGGGGYITLRSALPPEQMIHVLRSTVAKIDPLLPLQRVQTMDDVVSNVEAPRRFNTTLITTFAIGALLLALTGIYAVVAFSVSLRTREIAIRMALGAQRANIARLVLVSGVRLALLGCGLGVLGSFAASSLIRSLLFEVSATNPLIYMGSVLLMLLVALAASALPVRRASKVDPMVALRYE